MAEDQSKTFPAVELHGEFQKIIDDVWYITGTVMLKPFVRLIRNMVVVRHQGELTLINSIRLNESGEKALNALGNVTHIMKIGGHGMDDAYYLNKYNATHWTLTDRSENEKSNNKHILKEGVLLPFDNAELFEFKDTIKPETAILIKKQGGLLITCDSVQHWVPSHLMSLPAKLITKLLGFQKTAQIGPAWKKIQTPENSSLKVDFDRLAALPFERLIGGHGGLLQSNAQQLLKLTIERELK